MYSIEALNNTAYWELLPMNLREALKGGVNRDSERHLIEHMLGLINKEYSKTKSLMEGFIEKAGIIQAPVQKTGETQTVKPDYARDLAYIADCLIQDFTGEAKFEIHVLQDNVLQDPAIPLKVKFQFYMESEAMWIELLQGSMGVQMAWSYYPELQKLLKEYM